MPCNKILLTLEARWLLLTRVPHLAAGTEQEQGQQQGQGPLHAPDLQTGTHHVTNQYWASF